MGLILLRYGELALKGKNRAMFLRRLRSNVRACLKAHGVQGTVVSAGRRILVHTSRVDEMLEPLARVFGLVSISPVQEVDPTLDEIVEAAVQESAAAGVSPGVTFRVRTRRSDKAFPYTSPEINAIVGEAIVRELGGKVNLSDDADVTVGVEVHRDVTFVYSRVIPGPGGLPLGVEGRVVALISGGIDSPVAAWLMMKRGCAVIPVHFRQNDTETSKALDNIKVLKRYSYGWDLRPIILEHGQVISPTLRRLYALNEGRWSCIFCKRTLLLEASRIAETCHAQAIVMGDSLGQVASQTLHNMEVISYGIPKPILRPLIGLDKTEIVDLARRIGTFDISIRSQEGCRFLPRYPLTRATLEGLQRVEARLAAAQEEEGS